MKYLYNLTIHCEPALMEEVRKHILCTVIPQWQLCSPRPEGVHLLRVPDGNILAIQEVVSDVERIGKWSPMELSSVQELTRRYPERVLPFDTILEFIA